MPKLTLEDIGKLADVSRATVSRVINGYPHIRPEVRERVERVIQQTGFQPNAVARSLASNQSNIIGLFIPSVVQFIFGDAYLSALIPGIAQACNTHEYTLALFLFTTEDEEQKHFRRILGSSTVDGLIITADRRETTLTNDLLANDVPFVLIGRPASLSDRVSFVDAENVHGAYNAVNHLLQQGYQRIGLISTTLNTAAEDRTAGYIQALRDCGMPIATELIAEGDFTERSGYLAMQQLLPLRPDAVFATSDMMAVGALRAIHEARLSVPHDIALVSFDGLPPSENATPPISTVRQSVHEIGSLAVETLINIMQTGTQPPRHIILPTELVVRTSSSAVRSR
jgi:LacI family transcriptional regulator